MIELSQLPPEEKALMLEIRDRWVEIGLSTQPTNTQEVEKAVKNYYRCYGFYDSPPEFRWFDNPIEAANWLNAHITEAGNSVRSQVWHPTMTKIRDVMGYQLYQTLQSVIQRPVEKLTRGDYGYYGGAIRKVLGSPNQRVFGAGEFGLLALTAFAEAMGVSCPKVSALWEIAEQCNCWWLCQNVAIVVPNANQISVDEEKKLHAEGEPAITFPGFNYYAFHGVKLPLKYGRLSPQDWQPQWILQEKQAELKKVLIEGITYEKVSRELPTTVLATKEEYCLLKVQVYDESSLAEEYEHLQEEWEGCDDLYLVCKEYSQIEFPVYLYLLQKTNNQIKTTYFWRVTMTMSVEDAIAQVSVLN